jgi:hypothetical protein
MSFLLLSFFSKWKLRVKFKFYSLIKQNQMPTPKQEHCQNWIKILFTGEFQGFHWNIKKRDPLKTIWLHEITEILTSCRNIKLCLSKIFFSVFSKFRISSDTWMPVIERASWCQAWLFWGLCRGSSCAPYWEPCQMNDISWEPRWNFKKVSCLS